MPNRMTHSIVSLFFLMLIIFTLEGCKLGYNKTPKRNSSTTPPPECSQRPTNVNANDNTLEVFNLLSELSCGTLTKSNDGYLMGQSLGNGNQISYAEHQGNNIGDETQNSYTAFITAFKTKTKKTPALIAIDYEYDQLYTHEQLIEANNAIEGFWKKGGLVSISWTPLNPWINNGRDKTTSPGSHQDTKYTEEVNLADLLDNNTAIYTIWREKLDEIANALLNLQAKDDSVTILWRPLPEMNNSKYWWGLESAVNTDNEKDPSLYKALWEDMYEYFKEEKALKNLLWVYSPAESSDDISTAVDWSYPGKEFVDIVAGIARNDQLNIKDYTKLITFNKPLGMAEYRPDPSGTYSANGTFDNQTYADRLNGSYDFISYWVSWHSNSTTKQALIDNQNSEELVKRSYIFNLEDNKLGI